MPLILGNLREFLEVGDPMDDYGGLNAPTNLQLTEFHTDGSGASSGLRSPRLTREPTSKVKCLPVLRIRTPVQGFGENLSVKIRSCRAN